MINIREVQKWLNSARFSDVRIEALEELIVRTRARLEGSRASAVSDMPRGTKQSDWTDAVARIEEYEEQLEQLKKLRGDVKRAIERLEDPRQLTALELYYLRDMDWPDVAAAMGFDVRTMHRWHRRALQQIEKYF